MPPERRRGLERLVRDIEVEGSTGFLLDAAQPDTIEDRVAAVEAEIGPIEVVLFNLGAQIGNRPLAATSYKQFEPWRLATFALFRRRARSVRRWRSAARTILVTSATSAMRGSRPALPRGGDGRAADALSTLNAEFASKGIHVAHVVVDGAVDALDTLGKLLDPSASSSSATREVGTRMG